MGVSLLPASNDPGVCNNILRQVSFDYGIKLNDESSEADVTNNNYLTRAPVMSSPSSSSEITLPPINSLMKNQSPNYNLDDFDNLILMAKHEQPANSGYQEYIDNFQINNMTSSSCDSTAEKMNPSPTSIKQIKFTEMSEAETQKFACELCSRKYITKSNLEKHMRSHDLFMCVVCMKVSLGVL